MATDHLKCVGNMYQVMVRVRLIVIKFCVFVMVMSNANGDDNICPEQIVGNLTWPETKGSSCARSTPLCINDQMEITTRCCDAQGNWEDLPSCRYIQEEIKSPCPRFVTQWSKSMCIIVIEDTAYPPKCPYEETLPFLTYIESVDPAFFPIWMPISRYIGAYGIGLFHWMEPTYLYGDTFMSCGNETCDHYYYSRPITDKNCLLFHNASYAKAVPCNEIHTGVCAYRSLPERMTSYCSQNFPFCMQSDYSTKSKCFCQSPVNSTSVVLGAEFHEPYQNLLYPYLSEDMCYIGLEKRPDGSYLWENSNTIINYTHWAEDAVFGDDYMYGVISKNGWGLAKTKKEASCDIHEVDLPFKDNEISLEYVDDENRFIVNLTNPSSWVWNDSTPIVFCFTDAARDQIITKMEVEGSVNSGYATYFFQRHTDGPGTYWCEAFVYPDVTIKRSNEFLLRFSDFFIEEYVAILKTTYDEDSNPLTETKIRMLQNDLADQLEASDIVNFYPRIYKIVEVDEEKLEITLNFHIINPNQSEPLKLYSSLRGYLEQSLQNFTFINVFSVDKCIGIQTGNSPQTVTWPVTNINDVATKPREGYCVNVDGSIMYRYCNGNYIDGAQWSVLEEPCTIQQSTNVTVNLTNIINLNKPQDYIEQVVEIVDDHSMSLVPLDIHLLSLFLKQVAMADEIDIKLAAKIVSGVMNIPGSVIRESQAFFNSTDRILYYTDEIIKNSEFIGEIIESNIIIVSYNINKTNLSGLAVKIDDQSYFYTILYDEFDLNSLPSESDAALLLSPELFLQLTQNSEHTLTSNTRIIFTVFRNSELFNEEWLNLVNTSIILGVALPDFEEPLLGNIFAVYNGNYVDRDFNCSYWDYDLNGKRGVWKTEGVGNVSDYSIVCNFNRLTQLALTQRKKVNVTEKLENILGSNTSLSEKLESVYILISYYRTKFQPVDVMLVANLFYEVTSSSEDNIDVVAKILNKIIYIPTEVLQNSQLTYNATGKILIYFEQILKQSTGSRLLQTDNFYAIVQHLSEDIVYGFALSNCDDRCNLTLFNEYPTEANILDIENLDTALLLGKDILEQVLNTENYDPKLIVSIFLNDALFIEDNRSLEIGTKVVGVSIPDFEEELNEAIRLLYSIVSYTMYIDRDVLHSSQEQSQATDLILYHLTRIASLYKNNKLLRENNVALVTALLSTSGLNGIAVKNYATEYQIIFLYEENSSNLTQFDAVLRINTGVLRQLVEAENENYTARFVAMVFFDDSLFNEEIVARNANPVFGLYFPDYNQTLTGEIKLSFQKSSGDDRNYNCFTWNYQANKNFTTINGFWEYDGRCVGLGEDGIDRINAIVNNILKISKEMLLEAQINHQALSSILSSIKFVAGFSGSHPYSYINNNFGVVVCPLNSSLPIGAVVTQNEVSCLLNMTEMYFADAEQVIAGLALGESLLNQTFSTNIPSKIVVMVLLDDIFFEDVTGRKTSVILGISIPNLDECLQGDIIALFSKNLYNGSKYDCAYWNDTLNSTWNIERDKLGTGSFTQCNFKQATYLALIESASISNSTIITELLQTILNSNATASEKVNETKAVLDFYREGFGAEHVYIVAKILSYLDSVSFDDVQVTAAIASIIMNIPRKILVESQEIYNATDWILYQVDRIAKSYNSTAEIETDNLVVIINKNISGVAIKNCNITCEVIVLANGDTLDEKENINTALLIDDELAQQIQDSLLIVTVYYHDALFNEGYNSTYQNVGQIIGVIIPLVEFEMKGLFRFYYYSEVNTTEVCAFWNYTVNEDSISKGYWETEKKPFGPSQLSLCESKHSTHFALLETQKNVTNDLENILNSNMTVKEKLAEVITITSNIPDTLSAVDIHLIAKILDNALDDMDSEGMVLISHIISHLFHVPRKILRESQLSFNATDRILHSIDEMAKVVDKQDGEPIIQENFVVAVFELKSSNISGLMLHTCNQTLCNITILKK
ncbi:hypothetical protein NQ317_010833 [Molorchus minor]|uniref:Uncharacterized protein n=1 Tax=Molorchus minor TaxID=1323400 RepID=A0ABQ9JMH9_9CUCU|nr:hypothetical protein NQ317_010833 [Molorchus minor]